MFVNKIQNQIDPKILKIIFFSSFEIFNDKSKFPYYKISKILFYEEFLRLKNKDKKKCYKLLILGGINTETYLKNRKNNFLKKNISANIDTAVNLIIKKIKNDKDEIIFFPKKYFFLKKILILKKLFNK